MQKKLVLATTSIPRKQAFDELGIPYETTGSHVDERFKERPTNPKDLVLLLARLKAETVAKKRPDSIVIGFDSVGSFNGQILEKPESKQEAYERLQNFSGNSYKFFTGICLIEKDYCESKLVETNVWMRELDKEEIIKYLKQDENFNRYALGFDPLNTFGASFIKKIEGSYNNILRGIPLELIVEMIKKRGFEIK
jgi:septum formation protein